MVLRDKPPYDLLRDLVPVTEFSTQPFSLVIHPALQAKTVKDLVALARAKPGTMNYGSSGQGGISHLSGAMFGTIAGPSAAFFDAPIAAIAAARCSMFGSLFAIAVTSRPDARSSSRQKSSAVAFFSV